MDYYDYDEPYYEPSVTDEILSEYQEKMKEALLDGVKHDIENIKKENERLKKENEDLKNKTRDLDIRERAITNKEKDLEKKSEYTFYKNKFSEILKPLEEQLDMWYVERVSVFIPKCDLCDDDRKIIYKSSSGKKIKGDCDCKRYHTVYRVEHTEIECLNFFKSKDDRKFVMTPKYESKEYDNSYFKLDTQQLVKIFNIEEVSNYKCYGGYGGFTGFATKEECKKYCDWLNENKSNQE